MLSRASRLVCLLIAAYAAALRAEEKWSFDRDVAPLLAVRCLDCHSGAEPKGGLDLSRKTLALRGGETGAAIVPGKPDESLLWQHVRDDVMPPKHSLSAREKELLRAWIAGGAAWGAETIDRFRYSSDLRAGYDWWSLRPVVRPRVPVVRQSGWARNAVDAFVLARLEDQGLAPSTPAEPGELIRRLYFDLLGLPPPLETLQAFAEDPSDAAYERLVDELLASPRFGERWARHWLDVVRYGESDGFERNMPRENAWHYRDWVIQALNDDLPYDQFVRMQLAGDVVAAHDPAGVIATGFLVAGIHNTVVGSNEVMRLNARQDELEEILAVTGQAFLGMTVQCARCHDHKFDPVEQRDYYQLAAALAGVTHGERTSDPPARRAREEELKSRLAAVRRDLAELQASARQHVAAQRRVAGATAAALAPIARWSFQTDATDRIGTLHGQLEGGARVADGKLHLDKPGAFVITAPLAENLREKTLEAWVSLSDLAQRGGGVLSVESDNGGVFDAIVFGERVPRRWMAGSNNFSRTRDLDAPDESASPDACVHVAIVYQADQSIAVYRNGRPYAAPYKPQGAELPPFQAGKARVLLGKRHTGGGNPFFTGMVDEARLYNRALSVDEIAASYAAGPDAELVSLADALAALPTAQQQRHAELLQEQAALESELKNLPPPLAVFAVVPQPPHATHVLQRGNVEKRLELAAPGGIRALGGSAFAIPSDAPDSSRRLALANWLTRGDNPLLARVIVNRLWHHHFGTGIVDTPSDFGFNGGRPTHPELLDFLAAELAASGYHLKTIHRLLVTSSTYRQSSRAREEALAVDADARLLWRKNPQRLEAEVVRDAILTVAGELNPQMGGPGFKDVRTYFNNGTTYYEPLDPPGAQFQRRTIYRFSPRGERSPILDTLDCPDPSAATPRRQTTNTPLQALALLNNSFVLRMAKRFAARVEGETASAGNSDVRTQTVRAFQLALSRAPTPEELAGAEDLVRRHGLPALARALFNCSEFLVVP